MPKKKTARPEMSWIESRKQWRKRTIIGGKPRDVYGKTQDEVRAKIKSMEQQAEAGMVLGDTTTLVQYAREWYPVKTANLRPKSASVYKEIINTYIGPFFQGMKLADIKPLHVNKLLLKYSYLSHSRQSKILSTLSQLMKSAVENGLASKKPLCRHKAGR